MYHVYRRGHETWFINLCSRHLIPPSQYPHTMPEARECITSGKQAQKTFETAKAAGSSFILEAIAAEATKAEAELSGASSEVKEGLVYNLDAYSTIKRGQNHHQTHVFPPTHHVTAQNPHPPALTTLVLEKITYTNRVLILHFGSLFLMVCAHHAGHQSLFISCL